MSACKRCTNDDFYVRGKHSDLRRALGKVSRYPGSPSIRASATVAIAAYDKAKASQIAHQTTHEGAT